MKPQTFTWKKLTADELTRVYLDEMRRDFPSSELKPLSMILNSEAAGMAHTWGVFEGETLVSYLLMVRPMGCEVSQLDYFSVLPAYRSTGIGARLLAALPAHEEGAKAILIELRVPAHRPAESLEKRCERIYRSWGLSTYDANKRYLTGALRMMMGSDHRLAIRKEILGPVAEEYNLTVAAVDSALRRLLETLDETGTQTWRDFRKEYGLERRKVTIGRLLYALESKLSQQ